MIAELVDGRLVLFTEFREKELVKQIPGARWDNTASVWHLPLSWAGCCQLRGVFGASLQVGQVLATWVQEERTRRIDPCLALRHAGDADLPMFGALYPFQRAGVAFMATAGCALNADEMGLGKSVQAIAALELLGPAAFPALIVCPNSMKFAWADEFTKWAPGRRVVIITGTPKKRADAIAKLASGEAEVGIINYEALRSHTRLAGYGQVTLEDKERMDKELNAFVLGAVIADEAHRAKDPRSKQTRALWYIGDSARYRFALTGTPVANSPEDVWTLMRFVSPLEYPWKTAFIERYALQTVNIFGFPQVAGIKSEHSEELFRILDPRFIRRVKSVVLPQLPEKVYTVRSVRMETPGGTKTKQGQAYESMRKDMLAALDGGVLMAGNPLIKALRLCQFASAYGEMGEPAFTIIRDGTKIAGPFASSEEALAVCPEGARVKDETPMTLTEPSCKVDALEDIVLELGPEQAVVFSESRQLIELAHKRLIKLGGAKDGPLFGMKTGIVTGAIPPHERAEYVRQFQAGELKVLLLTLAAGGEGLTLTAASTAIFLQRSWNAVQNAQAEDRIHRIGQEAKSVTIIDVVTEGTIEQRVRNTLATKAGMLEEICRDEETIRGWLSK